VRSRRTARPPRIGWGPPRWTEGLLS